MLAVQSGGPGGGEAVIPPGPGGMKAEAGGL